MHCLLARALFVSAFFWGNTYSNRYFCTLRNANLFPLLTRNPLRQHLLRKWPAIFFTTANLLSLCKRNVKVELKPGGVTGIANELLPKVYTGFTSTLGGLRIAMSCTELKRQCSWANDFTLANFCSAWRFQIIKVISFSRRVVVLKITKDLSKSLNESVAQIINFEIRRPKV